MFKHIGYIKDSIDKKIRIYRSTELRNGKTEYTSYVEGNLAKIELVGRVYDPDSVAYFYKDSDFKFDSSVKLNSGQRVVVDTDYGIVNLDLHDVFTYIDEDNVTLDE